MTKVGIVGWRGMVGSVLMDRMIAENDFEGFERTVDVHVGNLRRKIEPDPKQPVYVKTVYGVGYKFSEG